MTGALGSDAMDEIRTVTPDTIEGGEGDEIEKAVRALLVEAVAQAAALERRMESAMGSAKGGGEFTFGDQDDFVRGLQGQIGLPNGPSRPLSPKHPPPHLAPVWSQFRHFILGPVRAHYTRFLRNARDDVRTAQG